MVEKSHTAGLWPNIYEPLRHFGTRVAEWFAPASDAKGGNDAYVITVELPGVDEKDIDLQVHDGVVVLKGEKREEREESGDTWFFSERQFGMFQRSFRLPADADEAGVKADLKNGVLRLTVPKKDPEAAKGAKSIRINAG